MAKENTSSGQHLAVLEAVKPCVTIADALHHSHEASVIHRDLKPHNIMLDVESQPHIIAFGRVAGVTIDTELGQNAGDVSGHSERIVCLSHCDV